MDAMNQSRELCAQADSISRRKFAVRTGLGLAGLALIRWRGRAQTDGPSELALARNQDRGIALRTAAGLLGRMSFGGKDLYLKGNYCSPDPYPATTHAETLAAVVALLREYDCGDITLLERSGMGVTRDVWESLGVTPLARKLGLRLLALEDLPADQWRREDPPGSNWKMGIEVPVFLDRDAYVVQICNLKTHRFGGIFSASLKNSIGLIAKDGKLNPGYNYMRELHASPQQCAMIAEANLPYQPKLIFMDAMQVFTSGGPDTGDIATPEVVMASADRLAIDAAGVALLRLQHETPGQPLSLRPVFEQDQLRRGAELGLGARSSSEIRFLTADARSARLASQLDAIIQDAPKEKK
jgi:uncharacterized protein (DUF362 family)